MQSPVPDFPRLPLADFVRGHQPVPDQTFSRVMASLLTAGLYALLLFMAGHRTTVRLPVQPPDNEIVTQLTPDLPHKKPAPEPPPHFIARLIRPPVQAVAPPDFTVKADAPPVPAMLSASAAPSSPLNGGPPAGGTGTATAGQQGMANGTNGNGGQATGCWDAAWAQRVTDRVKHFFYYPVRESRDHVTGVVLVDMVIRRYGRLELVKIGKSSGDKGLDQAATTMVRNAVPLPWIPEHMHADRIEAQLPIGFGMDPATQATIGNCS